MKYFAYDVPSIEKTYINEALNTTYKLSSCESDLKRRFSTVMGVYESWIKTSLYKNSYNKLGDFRIELSNLSQIEDICSVIENSYGWFPKCITVDGHVFIDWNRDFYFVDENDNEVEDWIEENGRTKNPNERHIFLHVEAKFTVEKKMSHNLYHVTEKSHLNKIKVQGLVPKSKGNFPDRIYFGDNINDVSDLMLSRYEHPVILKVDFEKYEKELESKYKFYIDPRLIDFAVYTYDSIDPKYIKVLVNGDWKKITK